MTYVIVTVKYPPKQQIDLMLPDNVPCQFLTEALSKTLKLPASIKTPIVFQMESDDPESQTIPPENTIAEMGILCGSYLQLVADTHSNKPEAYLISENGNKYILQNTNTIGRNDYSEQIQVDIDLTHLSKQRVVSRQHAMISLNGNGQYILEDHSKRGTWVNEQRIDTAFILQHGDIIDFGQRGQGATLTFVSNQQPTSLAAPPRVDNNRDIILKPVQNVSQPSLVSGAGDVFPIVRCPFTIGRPDKRQTPDLDLSPLEALSDQPISSRNHCTIIERNGRYELYAHDTSNGTFINGQELAPRDYKQLENNDTIEFGYDGVRLTFLTPQS